MSKKILVKTAYFLDFNSFLKLMLTLMILFPSCTSLYSQCGLELVLVDACNNFGNDEAYNEYFVFTAQSDIMASDVSISVSCPDGNLFFTTTMGVANTDGFVALMNTEMESVCGSGNGIFIDGSTSIIPAGAKVIAFNCPTSTPYLPGLMDFIGLCGSPSIYIIFGGSNGNTSFFKNYGGCIGCGCIRYIDITIDGCLAEINYDIAQMVDDDGAFISPGTTPDSPTYESSIGCFPLQSSCSFLELNSISITGCSSDLASYDLTQHNQSIFASSTAVYSWYLGDPASGGTIITSSSNYDLTNLTDDVYIVVTDNGCSNSLIIPVAALNLNATFSKSEDEICAGECVDFDILITGGTPNYNVNLIATFNSIPLNIMESATSANFSVQVCVESGVNFSYDPGSNVLTLGADLASSLSFTLVSIENGGCTFDFNQTLSMTINDAPTANSPSPKFLCDDDGDGIVSVDLNNYNLEVTNDGSSTIAWFSDAGATIPAPNPLLVSGAVTVYAVVSNANCSSQPVPMVINVTNGPDIDNPGSFEVCDEFTFPAITGTSLSIDVKYYDSPSGTGTSYSPGDTYSTIGVTTFYIFDGDKNCSDEEVFTVEILESLKSIPYIETSAEDICTGQPVDFVISITGDENTNLSYTILPPTGHLSGLQSEVITVQWNETGQYSLIVESSNECGILADTTFIEVNSLDAIYDTIGLCLGETLEFEGNSITEVGDYRFEDGSKICFDAYYVHVVPIEEYFQVENESIIIDVLNGPHEINILENDQLPSEYTVELKEASNPSFKKLGFEDGLLEFDIKKQFIDPIRVPYEVCEVNTRCNYCETGELSIIHKEYKDVVYPNVMTPNGDGINDYLRFNDAPELPHVRLLIYNRWGDKIHESFPYKNDWDGDIYPDGVYFYILQVGDDYIKRSFMLLR